LLLAFVVSPSSVWRHQDFSAYHSSPSSFSASFLVLSRNSAQPTASLGGDEHPMSAAQPVLYFSTNAVHVIASIGDDDRTSAAPPMLWLSTKAIEATTTAGFMRPQPLALRLMQVKCSKADPPLGRRRPKGARVPGNSFRECG